MRISDWSSDVCSSDLLALGQRVDIIHAFDHFAPDGILVVEEARVIKADEELAVRAVRILRPRHRADAAAVRFAAEFLRQVGKLAAAPAGPRRIAALRHEPGARSDERRAGNEWASTWRTRGSS